MSTLHPPLIGLFVDGTATGSFPSTLRETFQLRGLIDLHEKDLGDAKMMQALDILVLPGVTSEDSPYHRLLDAKAMAAIHEGLDNGLTMWTSCAAAYQMAARITYTSNYKQVKDIPATAVLSG